MREKEENLAGSVSLKAPEEPEILPRSALRKSPARVVKFAISFAMTAIFLYLAFQKTDLDSMLRSLGEVRLAYLLPSLSLPLLSLFLRSFLWKEIFRLREELSIRALFRAIVIGQMGNNLLPFRAGEFMRVYSIGTQGGISYSQGFSTLVVERTFDFISLAILTASVSYLAAVPQFLKVGLIVISCGILGTLGLLVCLANGAVFSDRVLGWARDLLPGSLGETFEWHFREVVLGLASLRSFGAVKRIFFLSLGCWGLTYLSYLFALLAYNVSVPWALPLLLLVLLNIGMMIPTVPGSLGVYQFFSVLALDSFQIEKSVALGFSFVLQAADILPVTLLGLWLFPQDGISKKLSR